MEVDRKLLKQIAEELALASHQAKDKELSGIVRGFQVEMREVNNHLQVIFTKVEELQEGQRTIKAKNEDFREDIQKRAVNWDNTQKIVYGLVSLMLVSLMGAVIGLVLI